MAVVRYLVVAGCIANAPAPEELDRDAFRCDVQPVLAARCAFPACHGTPRRPLVLFAPGRLRYQVGWDRPTAPVTDGELEQNFAVASGFATTQATGEPWLLAKPLAMSAGGYYHRGGDLYGGPDVFLTTDDPGYVKIASWVAGGTEAADCTPTTEVGP